MLERATVPVVSSVVTYLGGWVGGWVDDELLYCTLKDREERGDWNEVLWVVGGWVGGWVVCLPAWCPPWWWGERP